MVAIRKEQKRKAVLAMSFYPSPLAGLLLCPGSMIVSEGDPSFSLHIATAHIVMNQKFISLH